MLCLILGEFHETSLMNKTNASQSLFWGMLMMNMPFCKKSILARIHEMTGSKIILMITNWLWRHWHICWTLYFRNSYDNQSSFKQLVFWLYFPFSFLFIFFQQKCKSLVSKISRISYIAFKILKCLPCKLGFEWVQFGLKMNPNQAWRN